MITFNNLNINGKILDITIPSGSIVYLEHEFDFLDKKHEEKILYENFPIHYAKKSFLKNIFIEIKIGKMLNKRLSLQENMQIYSKIFKTECIWNLPLKYFNIPIELWKTKVKNLNNDTIMCAELGITVLDSRKICFLRNVSPMDNDPLEKFKNLITSKIQYGNEIVIYSGTKINFEKEIAI